MHDPISYMAPDDFPPPIDSQELMKTIGSSFLTVFRLLGTLSEALESARLITSIAMFYNLESAVSFVEDVTGLLSGDGIWHFEHSYILSMLFTNSYGTVRHEHLEFYSFTVC